jgi:hypothetical protein
VEITQTKDSVPWFTLLPVEVASEAGACGHSFRFSKNPKVAILHHLKTIHPVK